MEKNKIIMNVNAFLLSFFFSYLTNFRMLFSTNSLVNINSNFSIYALIMLTFIYFFFIRFIFIKYLEKTSSVLPKKLKNSFSDFFLKLMLFFSILATILSIYLFFKSNILYQSRTLYSGILPVPFNLKIIVFFLLISIPTVIMIQLLYSKQKCDKNLIIKDIVLPQIYFLIIMLFISYFVGLILEISIGVIDFIRYGA